MIIVIILSCLLIENSFAWEYCDSELITEGSCEYYIYRSGSSHCMAADISKFRTYFVKALKKETTFQVWWNFLWAWWRLRFKTFALDTEWKRITMLKHSIFYEHVEIIRESRKSYSLRKLAIYGEVMFATESCATVLALPTDIIPGQTNFTSVPHNSTSETGTGKGLPSTVTSIVMDG